MRQFLRIFIFTLLFSTNIKAADSSSVLNMLSNNQIFGMIPDVSDAYGVVFRDLNKDNHPDLYFTCFRSLNRLLINNGGIIPFVDRTIYSGTGGYLMVTGNKNLELGASASDFDNDGLPDLFLAGWGKTSRLLRNTGQVTFEDLTQNLNILGTIDANQGLWLDVNNDGFLDLYITDEHKSNRLFINQQNGFFQETYWTETFIDNANSQGVSHSDIDMDGDQDLYVSNWNSPDYFLLNDGQGLFSQINLDLPTLTDSVSTNSSAFVDYDNDGDCDLFIAANNGGIYFYKNISDSSGLKFMEITENPFTSISSRVFGLLFEDFDLDGWLDIFITTNAENRLYLNDRKGNFNYNYDSDKKIAYSTGSSANDIDGDGDLDIVVANKSDFSQIYLNPVNSKQFLRLKFLGVESNRDAIGTKVFIYAITDTLKELIGYREVSVAASYLSSKTPEILFSTMEKEEIQVEIIFPSGVSVEKNYTRFGRSHTIKERSGFLRSWYSSIRTLKFLSRRTEFWVNSFLVLLVLILISTYLLLGLKRYKWSAVNISFQLSVLFFVSLFIIIVLESASTFTILITILGLAILSILFLTLYSENFLRQRKKRDSIRKLLQGLSEKIVNIHDNHLLAEEIVNNFIKHPAIKSTFFYLFNSTKSCQLLKSTENSIIKEIKLSKTDIQILLNRKNFQIDQVSFDKQLKGFVNIIFPVKRKDILYALIALKMDNIEKTINQEDIEQLISIASQAAIAIENNNYIKDTAELIEQLTSSKIKAQYVKQLEKTNYELDEKNKELNKLFKELQSKEAQLIHSEKMASLGQLVAGISHELNNPISFIYTNMTILNDYINDLSHQLEDLNHTQRSEINNSLKELKAVIEDSSNGSKAIKEIVQNLKNFSRLDQAEWKEARISEILDSCLKIVRPQITDSISIKTNFKDDPNFFCYPGQLNQVFLNLITNAYQAFDRGSGTITIESKISGEFVEIVVQDDGPGIPSKVIKKVFDPFFTTKPVNEGTGLGLSISYNIIEKHKGKISVTSKKSGGTTFTILLPLKMERAELDV